LQLDAKSEKVEEIILNTYMKSKINNTMAITLSDVESMWQLSRHSLLATSLHLMEQTNGGGI
jgi:hypothetical protein